MKVDKRLLRQAWASRIDLALTVGLGLLAGIVIVGQARLLSRAPALLEVFRDVLTSAEVHLVGRLTAKG